MATNNLGKYEKTFIQELSIFSSIPKNLVRDFLMYWFTIEMEKLLESGEKSTITIPFIGNIKLKITPKMKEGEKVLDVSGELEPSSLLVECLEEIENTNQLSFIQNFFFGKTKKELEDIITS